MSGHDEVGRTAVGDRVSRFRDRIEQVLRKGAYDRWRPGTVPWGEASAAVRLDGILWAASTRRRAGRHCRTPS